MQILIIHGYRGPVTRGEYWLPNTTHDVPEQDAQYLIDNGHARAVPVITRSAPVAPVEAIADEPPAPQPDAPRSRRGNRKAD